MGNCPAMRALQLLRPLSPARRPCRPCTRLGLAHWHVLAALAGLLLIFSGEARSAVIPAADYTLDLPADTSAPVSLTLQAPQAGAASVLLRGLQHGGRVSVTVNGEEPEGMELLAGGGLEQGYADSALVRADLRPGENHLTVEEGAGAQIVRVPGTNLWFGTATEAGAQAVFSVDLDELQRNDKEYPVNVYYGPGWEPFCWFSGKLDRYSGDSYTEEIREVRGSSGEQEAELFYHLMHPPRALENPTSITLVREFGGESFTLRVRQLIRATGTPAWGDNLEFLHLIINETYGLDWEDGVPDYVWYRTQRGDAPDTLPGSHTTLARMDDNTRRVYPYPASTSDPTKIAISGGHHTGAAVSMEAVNSIGGWFTKSGVGSIGLVFHRYEASFRDDLRPLQSHCGDGADTHIYLFWGELFAPLGMELGDEILIEYSLTMLPAEPLHTDIEDLNEADLFYFGKEAEQRSEIVGWVGTKQALGLRRSDGSLILLGIGREPGRVAVPPQTQAAAQRVYRMFDLGRPRYQELKIEEGSVEVLPRWVTIVDCGSALHGPGE